MSEESAPASESGSAYSGPRLGETEADAETDTDTVKKKKNKQIVSLGAGSDTRFWRLRVSITFVSCFVLGLAAKDWIRSYLRVLRKLTDPPAPHLPTLLPPCLVSQSSDADA